MIDDADEICKPAYTAGMCTVEKARLHAWVKEHKCVALKELGLGTDSSGVYYLKVVPGCIEDYVAVVCDVCKEETDLTHYEHA